MSSKAGQSHVVARMRNRKRILLYALIALVGVASLWLLLRTNGFVHGTTDSALQIAISAPEPGTLPGSVKIKGSTTKASNVQLLINSVPYEETWTGANNFFTFDNLVLPSKFRVSAQAVATEGKRHFGATISGPAPIPLAVASTQQPAQATTTRQLTASVSYRRLDVHIRVELPTNDPRAVALEIRKLSLPEFIRRVFLNLTINDEQIDNKFRDVPPKIETSATSIVVSASSNQKDSSFIPNQDGVLWIRPGWQPENSNDVFTLNVVDYSIQSLEPAPATATGDSFTWTGRQGLSAIKVGLNYDAWGTPKTLLRVLRLSPYDLLPFWGSPVVATILALLVAIPIIWFLFILKKTEETSWIESQFNHRLEFTGYLLLAIIFSAPAIYSMYNLASRVNLLGARFGHRFKDDDDFRLLLITTLLVGLVVLLLRWIAKLIDHRQFGFWLRLILGGFGGALVLTVLIMITIGLTLAFVPDDRTGVPEGLASVIALALFLLLVTNIVNFYRAKNSEGKAWVSWRKAAVIIVGALLVGLLLVNPKPPSSFNVIIAKRHTPTLIYVRTFMFLIRDLMPYALVPGIGLLLYCAENYSRVTDPLVWKIANLLFVGYLVGSTSNVLMMPIPFLLALWVFPRYVLDSPDRCQKIDSIRNDIFTNRVQRLKTVVGPSDLKMLRDSLEQLEKNMLAGEVLEVDYQRLKSTIEGRLQQINLDNSLQDDLEVEDVVIGIGLRKTNWENGKWAAICGFLLTLPFSVLYLWELLQRTSSVQQSYSLLGLAVSLTTFVAYWTLCGFFFGYFFPYIRGKSGLRKGLILSSAIIACLLIVWVLSLSSFYAFFLRVGQTFLFFTVLGVWSDYLIFRKDIGAEFNWKDFTQFEYIPSLAAFASVALASLSTAANSVMQDQYQSIIKQFIGMVSQQLPRLPP